MKLSATAFAILSLLWLVGIPPAAAHSSLPSEDPWNPAHIEVLPREVRATVEHFGRVCGSPVAGLRLFSRYIQDRVTGDKFISLHFEDLRCANKPAVCKAQGCLHQVYVSKGGPYRLIMSLYVPEIEFKLIDGSTAVEIKSDGIIEPCFRDFRWNGSRLNRLK